MEKMMNTKTEGNTFTKKIGQTVMLSVIKSILKLGGLIEEKYDIM